MGNSSDKPDGKGDSDDDDGELSDEDAKSYSHMERRKRYSHTTSFQQHSAAFPGETGSKVRSSSMHEHCKESGVHDANKLNANLLFYKNKKKTQPKPGYEIKEILKWHGDYELLEQNPYFMQWLFPTKNPSLYNLECQPLQDHEARAIKENEKLFNRAYRAFSMMLDYYGMEPKRENGTFQIVRSQNWDERYRSLNRCQKGDCLKISRILSSMGEMGFRREQCVWLKFLLIEIIQNKVLRNLDGENIQYWLESLAEEEDRDQMFEFYTHLKSVNPDQQLSEHVHVSTLLESDRNLGPTNTPSRLENDDTEPMECVEYGIDAEYYFNCNLKDIAEKKCIFNELNCMDPEHMLSTMPNVQFYLSRMRCRPLPGFYLEELKSERVSYYLMGKMHQHIQWLFPTPERSVVNPESVPITEREALVFENYKDLQDQFIQVYRMMLDCYGLDIESMETGEIVKRDGWITQFAIIDRLPALPRIITRIVTSLGVLGFTHFQTPLVYFFLNEAIVENTLKSLDASHVQFWIGVISCNEERQMVADALRGLRHRQYSPALVSPEWGLPELRLKNRNTEMSSSSTLSMDQGVPSEWDADTTEEERKIREGRQDTKSDVSQRIKSDSVRMVPGRKLTDERLTGIGRDDEGNASRNKTVLESERGQRVRNGASDGTDKWMKAEWELPGSSSTSGKGTNYAGSIQGVRSSDIRNARSSEYETDFTNLAVDTRNDNPTVDVKKTFDDLSKSTKGKHAVSGELTKVGKTSRKHDPAIYGKSDDKDAESVTRGLQNVNRSSVHVNTSYRTVTRHVAGANRGSKVKQADGRDAEDLDEVVESPKDEKPKGFGEKFSNVLKRLEKWTDKFFCGSDYSRWDDDGELAPYDRRVGKMNANVEFYRNIRTSSFFWGHKIEDMLGWKGDYYKLEMNHQYIQWLFPIREGRGMNLDAQALQQHEAEEISQDPILRRRVLRAFEMMLDFYGMELMSEESTEVQRTKRWVNRYEHLNRSGHNHLRITRIVKSLGHLGLQKYQAPWVNFIMHEIFEEKVLSRLGGRQLSYWINAIADKSEMNHTYMAYLSMKDH